MNSRSDKLHLRQKILTSAALLGWLSCLHPTEAAPIRLHCVLSSSSADTKPGEIDVTFDVENNSLTVDRGAQHSVLSHVTISTISIDGYTQAMSVGIDRSSWSIVVQTYTQDPPTAEFGVCKPAAADHS